MSSDQKSTPQVPFPEGLKKVASEVVKGIDLTNKVAIVTGGSSGIGVETARALAQQGAHVIIAVRDLKKAEPVLEDIKKTTKNEKVEAMLLQLDSLKEVQKFVDEFHQRKLPLHILINNAGIMACPYTKTVDGFESQFAVNHLAHFVLTLGLTDLLIASKPARVVSLSSVANKRAGINWEDINWEKNYNKWLAYAQSKSANLLFAVEYNNKFASLGVTCNGVHPGGIMTGLQKDLPLEEQQALGWIDKDGKPHPLFKTTDGGAATSVWAATSPDLEGKGGFYLEDCSISKVMDIPFFGCAAHAVDPEQAKKLWTLSEEMVTKAGIKLPAKF